MSQLANNDISYELREAADYYSTSKDPNLRQQSDLCKRAADVVEDLAKAYAAMHERIKCIQSETRTTGEDAYRQGWNEALDRCLLAAEGEQAKYIVARSGDGAAAVRGALEYAMTAMRKLRVP